MLISISRKSWHYRLLVWMFERTPPRNICPYMRALVKAFFVIVVAVAIIMAALLLLSVPFIMMMIGRYPTGGVVASVVIYLIFGQCLNMVFTDFFAHKKYLKLEYDHPMEWWVSLLSTEIKVPFISGQKTKIRSEMSIFPVLRAWANAVHDKVCSRIDFKE